MKAKLVKNRREKREQLVIRTSKGETLDYAQAELVRASREPRILPFEYEQGKQGDVRFAYDVTGMVPLDMYLGADLSSSQFRSMLDDVIESFEWCSERGLDPTRLLFDRRFMRLDPHGNRLAFAYLPAHGLPADRATAMDLLRFIAGHTSFVCKENEAEASALLDYLLRQTVFSSVEFKAFLETTAFGKGLSIDEPAAPFAPAATGPARAESPFANLTSTHAAASGSVGKEGAYDFVKAQSGSLSAQDARSRLSFAELVASDVAQAKPSAKVAASPAPPLEKREETPLEATGSKPHSTSLLGSSPLGQASTPASPLPRPRKLVLVRTATGEAFPLDPAETITLGRSKHCTIRVADNPSISRVHVTITACEGAYRISDQGSLNRTYVDGIALEPFAPVPLACGATFLASDEKFALLEEH